MTLSHLFGVPGDVELTFVPPSGDRPASMLIYGENGTGKSSIAKTLEWVIQDRVNRKRLKATTARTRILNIADPNIVHGEATVTLSDGTQLRRAVNWDPLHGELIFDGTDVAPQFARSPIVLTRADILSFISSAPAARGHVFLDFAIDTDDVLIDPARQQVAEITAVHEEILRIKKQIREAAAPLANHLGVQAPYTAAEIDQLINDLYHGLPPRRRYQVLLPKRVQTQIEAVQQLRQQLAEKNAEKRSIQKTVATGATQRVTELKTVLGHIDDWLTAAFHEITQSPHIDRIRVRLGESSASAMDIEVHTHLDHSHSEIVFSEGYQDLLAMLFFLATARATAAQGQAQVLILDDVLQSVDAHIRVALMQFVLREFKQWQLIVTVHDRLWREQLHKLFNDAAVPLVAVELRDWTFGAGSRLDQPNRDPSAALRAVLPLADVNAASGLAGRLLEQICDVLSWTIPISVQRKYGDRYTLDDLWPGVASALRNTAASECVTRVQGLRHLRNLVGAHHNEWAQTVTWSEVQRFAEGVLELFDHAWCKGCKAWVSHLDRKTLQCHCGATQLTPLYRKS